MNFFKLFAKDETGAVTVDWVVLTGGVVILGGLAAGSVSQSLGGITTQVTTAITGAKADAEANE